MDRQKKQKRVLIGDGGVFEKPDLISKITIGVSVLIIVLLCYLAVMAVLV